MKYSQLEKRYGKDTVAIAHALGYTLQSVRNWRADGIPLSTQRIIEKITGGALKADTPGRI